MPEVIYCQKCGHGVEVTPVKTYKLGLRSCHHKYLSGLAALGGEAHTSLVTDDYTVKTNLHQLKHWGIIEQSTTLEGKPVDGMWRLTDIGWKFINNEIAVYKYCVKSETLTFEGPKVFFRDLKEKTVRAAVKEEAKPLAPYFLENQQTGLDLRGTLING